MYEIGPRRWIVTGTDTDVGKTALTAALAAGVRATGATVVAAKPLASGVEPGTWGADAARLAQAAGHDPWVRYRYEPPISPHRAQILAGVRVDWDRLVSDLAALTPDVLLVEGAGGWRAPLAVDLQGTWREARDLAQALGAAPLLVTADRLGCIHHTRATVEVMTADRAPPRAIVLNRGATAGDASCATNLEDLTALLRVPIVVLPAFDLNHPESMAEAGVRLIADLRDAGIRV